MHGIYIVNLVLPNQASVYVKNSWFVFFLALRVFCFTWFKLNCSSILWMKDAGLFSTLIINPDQWILGTFIYAMDQHIWLGKQIWSKRMTQRNRRGEEQSRVELHYKSIAQQTKQFVKNDRMNGNPETWAFDDYDDSITHHKIKDTRNTERCDENKPRNSSERERKRERSFTKSEWSPQFRSLNK